MAKTIQEIEAIIGAKPSCDRLDFKRWLLSYLSYRINVEAPLDLPNQINYYFSSAGSDSNDGLSPNRAKATITGCQVLLAALNKTGNYGFNFRVGDTFTWTANSRALNVNSITGVVIRSYRDSTVSTGVTIDYSIISAWKPVSTVTAAASSWVSVGTNAYVLGLDSAAGTPQWIKNGSGTSYILNPNPSYIYREAESAADILVSTGSFRVVGNLLYVKPHDVIHPSGLEIHVSTNDTEGVLVQNAETLRMDRIVSDGFGIGTSDNGYNITAYIRDRKLAVFTNCGAYYGGNHLMGTLQSTPGESGGFSVFYRNHVGLMRMASNGETAYIAYATGGANEYIFCENSGTYSTMASGNTIRPRGRNVYGHTGGTVASNFGVAMDNFTNWDPQIGFGQANYLNDFQTLLTASGGSYNACSGFLINEDSLFDLETTINGLPNHSVVNINPTIRLKVNVPTLRNIIQQGLGAGTVARQKYFINPEFHIYLPSGNTFDVGMFGSTAANNVENADIYNGLVSWYMEPGVGVSNPYYATMCYNFGKTTTGSYHPNWVARNVRAYNTIFTMSSTGTPVNNVNLHNAAPGTSGILGGMEGCAFFKFGSGDYTNANRIWFGFNRSTNPVMLTGHYPTGFIARSNSALINNNITNYIEYDKNWHARTNKVIGPYDYNGPAQPSGARLTSTYSLVTGTISSPLERDVTTKIYRKADNQFAPGILIANVGYPGTTGVYDNWPKGDRNYTYTFVYTDRAGNSSSADVVLGLGGTTRTVINSAIRENNIDETTAGIDTSITDQSPTTSGVYNRVYELIHSKIIGINGKVYNSTATGVLFSSNYTAEGPAIGEGGIPI